MLRSAEGKLAALVFELCLMRRFLDRRSVLNVGWKDAQRTRFSGLCMWART